MEVPVVRSNVSGKAICLTCVYCAKVRFGEIPQGSIYCFGCQSVEGFTLCYPVVRVEWVFSGFDKEQEIIYSIKNTTGSFQRTMRPDKAVCSKCHSVIHHPILGYNKYVLQAHNP